LKHLWAQHQTTTTPKRAKHLSHGVGAARTTAAWQTSCQVHTKEESTGLSSTLASSRLCSLASRGSRGFGVRSASAAGKQASCPRRQDAKEKEKKRKERGMSRAEMIAFGKTTVRAKERETRPLATTNVAPLLMGAEPVERCLHSQISPRFGCSLRLRGATL